MAASAGSAADTVAQAQALAGAPAFILAADVQPYEPAWCLAEAHAQAVASSCAAILGFETVVRLAAMSGIAEQTEESLARTIAREAEDGANEIFVLPAALEINLLQREALGHVLGEARRRHADSRIYHDDADPGDSLLVECYAGQVERALTGSATSPQRTGLILAASGEGDASTRAQSYRLMRLVWERLGLTAGEAGFLRHAQPFLLGTLERCAQRELDWVMLVQTQWRTEQFEHAETILRNFQRANPGADAWRLADPPGDHPAITAWLTQRITRLWNEKRTREAARIASPKQAAPTGPRSWNLGAGIVAAIPERNAMADLLARVLSAGKPERILVKVTWHGYATGTYTDPAALDLLLGALPAKAVILEGHTASRNSGGASFDWEAQARENRAWIRQQEAEYLRRTGLADVLAKHGAQYVNVTEAYWDDACAPPERVHEVLQERGVELRHPEMERFIPEILLDYRGCPMISFAKFKGPTRLAISNMFGLLPDVLRSSWHGPNITYFARAACDLAKLYGALFNLCGVDEALYSAVRWNRRGLYRSRWGNYDLIGDAGYVTASRGLASADMLASRLQGQDVNRSAFFDVVRAELGWDASAAQEPLPQPVRHVFT
jgi:hypothetical protein